MYRYITCFQCDRIDNNPEVAPFTIIHSPNTTMISSCASVAIQWLKENKAMLTCYQQKIPTVQEYRAWLLFKSQYLTFYIASVAGTDYSTLAHIPSLLVTPKGTKGFACHVSSNSSFRSCVWESGLFLIQFFTIIWSQTFISKYTVSGWETYPIYDPLVLCAQTRDLQPTGSIARASLVTPNMAHIARHGGDRSTSVTIATVYVYKAEALRQKGRGFGLAPKVFAKRIRALTFWVDWEVPLLLCK